MMNDPTVLEASRVLAGKLLKESSDPANTIQKAFRLIVCRMPTEKEMQILEKYYTQSARSLTKDSAEQLLKVGEYPEAKGLEVKSWAAMMKVISMIYNLEETISKT
jgi:DNA-directed RNA polymerase